MKNQKIVLVLGMHRGGTSLISRGLVALGVFMGNKLDTSGKDNPKGFWEDSAIVGLNERVLHAVGASWDSIGLIEPEKWQQEHLRALELEAVELLRDRFANGEISGFKDPRSARLLPFWQRVISRLQISDSYVIVVRNPLSVARSLAVRNGFSPEKSHILWLEHLLLAIRGTSGRQRIVVDYDEMMENPAAQLERVAQRLSIPLTEPVRRNIAAFTEDFVAQELRHAVFSIEDVSLDPAISSLASEAYQRLYHLARDEISFENLALSEEWWAATEKTLHAFSPFLRFAADRDLRVGTMARELEERNSQNEALTVELGCRNSQNEALTAELGYRNSQIDTLMQELDARERLAQELTKYQASLEATLSEKQKMLMEISDWATGQTQQLNFALSEIKLLEHSRSWRLTAPLRHIKRLLLQFGTNPSSCAHQFLYRLLRSIYRILPLGLRYKLWLRNVAYRIGMLRARRPQYPLSNPAGQGLHDPSAKPHLAEQATPDMFFWGVIDWHFRFQRPQHLAASFANKGYRVFYFSPEFIACSEPGFVLEPLDASGRLFSVSLHAAGKPVIYHAPPSVEVLEQLKAGAAKFLQWSQTDQCIAVIQHPFWRNLAAALPGSRLLYDCMDHHDGFGNTAPEILSLEKQLMEEADLLIVTSQWLADIGKGHNKNVALVRNACDFEHFFQPPPDCYADAGQRKIVGYYGAIAEWFDIELLRKLSEHLPDCLLLLVGADTVDARRQLVKCRNVAFMGEVSYKELPRYLHAFDVCLLPFQVNPLTLATNPVKVYEYLAAGKAVVAIDLPEMQQFKGLIAVAATHGQFIEHVVEALNFNENENIREARRAFAREQTWEHRAGQLEQHLAGVPEPLVSIIVVTYNNLALTKACLESIERFSGGYPNCEIIIVDNASTDGTPDYLTGWCDHRANWTAILNSENRGFSAANNQGLFAAKGDYLAMLNNDTVVTAGWVRTLVNHLKRNPGFGLVGPITNNIGNEARVDVRYTTPEEMHAKARDMTLSRMGTTFGIRTLAFFCVMMPRKVYDKVGPLDEAFGLGFFEDDDYCRRIEAHGWQIACAEDVFIHHHLSASFDKLKQKTRQELFERNRELYEAKWGKWVPHSYR